MDMNFCFRSDGGDRFLMRDTTDPSKQRIHSLAWNASHVLVLGQKNILMRAPVSQDVNIDIRFISGGP